MLYEAASWDTHVAGPLPGAVALRDYAHSLGFSDAGIYNDRAVRGTTAVPSVHREGRAVDLTVGERSDNDLIDLLLELIAHCDELGVQQVIFQRAVWTVGRTWRPYSGTDPHTSHSHVELTWEAAESLTVDCIRDVLHPPASLAEPVGDDDMYFVKDDRPEGWSIWHLYRHQDTGLLVRREVPGIEWAVLSKGYESKLVTAPWADVERIVVAPGL